MPENKLIIFLIILVVIVLLTFCCSVSYKLIYPPSSNQYEDQRLSLDRIKEQHNMLDFLQKVSEELGKIEVNYWLIENTLEHIISNPYRFNKPDLYSLSIGICEQDKEKLKQISPYFRLSYNPNHKRYEIQSNTNKNLYVSIKLFSNLKDVFPLETIKVASLDYAFSIPKNSDKFNKEYQKEIVQEVCQKYIKPINGKPCIWVYWDNIKTNKTPDFIQLCHETLKKQCGESFEIIFLNKDNITNYLPELKHLGIIDSNMKIPHKVDIYRIMLLHKCGGIYIDSDVITLRNPIEIITKLKYYDFVGFGCTGKTCGYGYMKPSNWIMCSRKNTKLMKLILGQQLMYVRSLIRDKQDLSDIGYHSMGKTIIWNKLRELKKLNNYGYYHYGNDVDGTRDANNFWVSTKRLLWSGKNDPIKYRNEKDMMFLVFYNSNKDLQNFSREQLLNGDYNISRFYKRGLGLIN